jgi:hypothetical protein
VKNKRFEGAAERRINTEKDEWKIAKKLPEMRRKGTLDVARYRKNFSEGEESIEER